MIDLALDEYGTQQERVLAMLRERPCYTGDFLKTDLAAEYRAAITRLRQKGHNIKAERVTNSRWLYRLE